MEIQTSNTGNMTWMEICHDTAIGGIDFSDRRNGGADCKNYSSTNRILTEGAVFIILSFISILTSRQLDRSKNNVPNAANVLLNGGNKHQQNGVIKRIKSDVDTFKYSESLRTGLLFVYILVNGLELGYKVIRYCICRTFI